MTTVCQSESISCYMFIYHVLGLVDSTGYMQAEVDGRIGLVPEKYLVPLTDTSTINSVVEAETVSICVMANIYQIDCMHGMACSWDEKG
jgi:hypothetical protein